MCATHVPSLGDSFAASAHVVLLPEARGQGTMLSEHKVVRDGGMSHKVGSLQ